MIGTKLRVINQETVITVSALTAGIGGIKIMKAADNTQIGVTLTAVGQSVKIPAGTIIYAKSVDAQAWVAVYGEDYYGSRLTLTGATDGAQSINLAVGAFFDGWSASGSVSCQTGNVTAQGSMSVSLVRETGP